MTSLTAHTCSSSSTMYRAQPLRLVSRPAVCRASIPALGRTYVTPPPPPNPSQPSPNAGARKGGGGGGSGTTMLIAAGVLAAAGGYYYYSAPRDDVHRFKDHARETKDDGKQVIKVG